MTKKNHIIIPKVKYTYSCNVNSTTPEINTKKTDYDSIRNIVQEKDTSYGKEHANTNEKIIKKLINKFQIV